jgi:peptidoglycan/xylan/chitin deacetylase (PgdA/CDA1 family)
LPALKKIEQRKTTILAITAVVAALELRKKSHSSRTSPITYLIFTTVLLLVTFSFSFHLLGGSGFAANNNFIPYANAQSYEPCNCVIFRLDDVVDGGNNVPMTAIMNHFINENKKLSSDIIVSQFGNSGPNGLVFKTVEEGHDKGLFEIGIHGYEHVKHSELSLQKQKDDFTKAKNKLLSLLGDDARLFGAPFNWFNADTIKAMAESGLDIFSTSYYDERVTTNPYKVSTSYTTDNSIIQLSEVTITDSQTGGHTKKRIYHVPFDISLLNLANKGYSGNALTQEVLRRAEINISKYGFAVVVLHPTDVGTSTNQVNPNKFQVLVDITNGLEDKGIGLSHFSGVTPPPFSEPIVKHATTLTLNTITSVPWGKDITVTGKLTDNAASGAGVGGATISFDGTGANNLPDVVTNTDGTFTAKGASPATVATGLKVQAHFAGNSDYAASNSIIKTYSTTKHSVSVALATAATKPWGMPSAFIVTLTDASTGGTVIQGKTIHFDGTGVIGVADKVTGTDGKATGTGTAPNTVATGWTSQAHFAGDSLYNAKDSSVKSYSTTKHFVTLSLSVPTNAVSSGTSYKVSGTLTDSTVKKPLASKTITFTADEPITIGDKTTNTDGVYSGTQTAPSTAGSYNIQSHFAGDSLYNAKDSVMKTLTVTVPSSAATTEAPSTTTPSSESSSLESPDSSSAPQAIDSPRSSDSNDDDDSSTTAPSDDAASSSDTTAPREDGGSG